jgi:hypothetical protein
MTDEQIDNETFRRGVMGVLSSMENQIEGVRRDVAAIKSHMPTDEQRAFEAKVFETSQNIEAIYAITTKIVALLRKIGLWLAGITAGYLAAKQFIVTEWELLSQLWRR